MNPAQIAALIAIVEKLLALLQEHQKEIVREFNKE
jgi:hypothetical protein